MIHRERGTYDYLKLRDKLTFTDSYIYLYLLKISIIFLSFGPSSLSFCSPTIWFSFIFSFIHCLALRKVFFSFLKAIYSSGYSPYSIVVFLGL